MLIFEGTLFAMMMKLATQAVQAIAMRWNQKNRRILKLNQKRVRWT